MQAQGVMGFDPPAVPTKTKKQWMMGCYFAVIWMFSVLLQLVLAGRFRGYLGDQMIFHAWMTQIDQFGIANIYKTGQVDYPPVYLFMLDLYGKVANAVHIAVVPGGLWMKMPGIVLDACAMIAFFFATRGAQDGWRATVLTLFCLNPTILFDTAVWGQVDILDGILSFLAVAVSMKKPGVAGGVFSLSLLSKFQSIVVFPVLAVQAVRDGRNRHTARTPLRLALGVALPLVVIFGLLAVQGALGEMIDKAYIATTGEYPYVDMGAMNIWYYLFGTPPNLADSTTLFGGVTYKLIGLTLLFLATLYVACYLWFHQSAGNQVVVLKAATALCFAFYMLPTEIHERYVIMALIFSLAAALYDKRWMLLAVGLTLTSFCNLWSVCYNAVNPTSDMWMVYLNCVMLIAMFVMMRKEVVWPHNWRECWRPPGV
ncbi:transporter [Alicyclobacillus fastidiosus]|uniref:Transporter n=1 Tax=Alicyclobacillus fastidiosus TaxID=392011 RepID=A0ABV5AF53_9BACL|nr:transporter [Alicyclobacillus fastidiosus]WEH09479.1 transporter [Alicyclobacillus fastidiosus]